MPNHHFHGKAVLKNVKFDLNEVKSANPCQKSMHACVKRFNK